MGRRVISNKDKNNEIFKSTGRQSWEIAVRVMQTAKAMGYQTVAVYSDADRHARHVQEADEAVYIGASKVSESYLSIVKIIDACKNGGGCSSPRLWLLSENTEFAQACIDNQITFIGPTASAIELMGSKRLQNCHDQSWCSLCARL